jgi:hypothetical protein
VIGGSTLPWRVRVVLVCAALAAAPLAAQSASSLPDWSGLWGHGTPLADELRLNPPPLKPELLRARETARVDDSDPVLARYCRPLQFTGSSGGFTEAVEFLFTPGRVTITNEMGLVRRIYTDGRVMPPHPAPTNTGVSVGRWEGETLVVETTGINPAAMYPTQQQGAVPIGENVRITERIYLTSPSTLQFDVTTVAPDVLTQPDRRTRVYSRLAKATPTEITFCTDYDRSIDPTSGKQRFDMTPPPDLPPPPPR